MAIFHHAFSRIDRGSHTCPMATAAYRSGSKLTLEFQTSKDKNSNIFQKTTFDYSTKKGIGFSQVITTDNVPDGLKSRQSLWQFVEDNYPNEKYLACESTFALPEELSLKENISLILEYIEKTLLTIYQIVDVNIHNENLNNPHVHLLSPLIVFSKDDISGSCKLDRLKYDDIVQVNMQLIEDNYIEIVNKHLALKGLETYISNKADKILDYGQLRPWL